MKRILSAFLSAVLLVTLIPISVFATSSGTTTLKQKETSLESKYGISITYSTSGGKAIINQNTLNTLDKALATVTPAAIKQISSYYQKRTGNKLTISFVRPQNSSTAELGSFSSSKALIKLYIPASSSSMASTGESPVRIIHEIAHAIYVMYTNKYGESSIKSQWTKLNGKYSYKASNIKQNPSSNIFVSAYAATSFQEDIAEMIGHGFIRYNAGQGFYQGGANTTLRKKAALVEKILSSTLNNSSTVIKNYRRGYTAAKTVKYKGMTLSGETLIYSGYTQPLNMLNSIVKSLGYTKKKAQWVKSIGMWYVETTSGQKIMVSPYRYWFKLNKNFSL